MEVKKLRNEVKSLLAWGLVIILITGAIFGALWAANSWTSLGVGEAMFIVDKSNGTISEPILGPAAGFLLDGFKRIVGLQYPIFIYYQIDSVGMWSEWKMEGGNFIESARGDYPAVKTLSKDGFNIISISDVTRVPRGGPKKAGGRRGRRV